MYRSPLFRQLVLALQAARHENLTVQGLPTPITGKLGNWPRRKFIKAATALGMAGFADACTSRFPLKTLPKSPSIAIIGAGLAGLNAAYRLKKAGICATLYEARSRAGGRIHSVDMGDGLIADLGAELINTDHADMLDLVKEFKIELFNRKDDLAKSSFPNEAYFFDGISYSEAQLIEDLRPIVGQMTMDAALLDKDWETNAPHFDRLSVADYLNLHLDKITKPYLYKLMTAMTRTEFGVEPADSSAIQFILVLPVIDGENIDLLSYSDEIYSVVGGSAKITDALAAQLKPQLKLGKRLTEIQKREAKYHLSFADQTAVSADAVIIAIPFPVLSTIKMDVPVPALLRNFIDEAMLGANEKIIAVFNQRFWRRGDGFSGAAWTDFGCSEVWDECQRQAERTDGALNFFLGGEQTVALKNTKAAKLLGNHFIDQLNHFIHGASAAANGRFVHSAWTASPLSRGGYANYKPGQLTRYESLFWRESQKPAERQSVVADNLIFAGEHLSEDFYGFMNGAAQTGRLAADWVLETIDAG